MVNLASLPQRITEKIAVDPESGCWLWTGKPNATGYGVISVDSQDRRAHRYVYELLVGPIIEETLDHLCMVKMCVNPEHLEPVSIAENVQRWARTITHCPQGHEYTTENTGPAGGQRRSSRRCLTCHRTREANRKRAMSS